MKVLLLSFNWVEYLIEMANALTARGHQCEVIFKTSRVRETVGEALPRLLRPQVPYHLLDDRPGGLRDPRQVHTILRLIHLIRAIAPDVINLHEATTTYLPFCLALAGRRPLVLTVHDVSRHPGHDAREPGRRAWVRDYLRRRADAVILHGEWLLARYLAESGEICRNAHVIPHGCYTVLKHWAREAVHEVPDSVLFFGRIHEYKGLEYLLRAAEIIGREVHGFRVIIAGDGAELESRGRELLANPRCIVHRGYLGNAEVARVFQESSVVVLPYVEGSQSGVVRIAYVFGKPVIVTDVGSIPESVKHNTTGLVVPARDEAALAAAIVDLLKDGEKRRSMGREAARMVDGDLSWADIARRTEAVFEEVTGRVQPASATVAAKRTV